MKCATDSLNSVYRSSPRARTASRSAFTLIELSVSIGILALMLALASVVFKWTLDSTGQARELITINDRLRAFEATLREDVKYVVPDRALMVLQTNQINVYWRAQERDADNDGNPLNGYPHPGDPERENPYLPTDTANNPIGFPSGALLPPRADVLMFFTQRPGTSFIDPAQRTYIQQVVYGHAEIGTLDATGALTVPPGNVFSDHNAATMDTVLPPPGSSTNPSTTRSHALPAHDWHVARRSVLISELAQNDPSLNPPPLNAPIAALSTWRTDLSTTGLGRTNLTDAHNIIDGRSDMVARNAANAGGFSYDTTILGLDPAAPPASNPMLMPNTTGVPIPWSWYARCRLDPAPPAAQARRLGAYLLPQCASFKVEWTCLGRPGPANIELHQMVWFDMQNPNGPFWEIDPSNTDNIQSTLPVGDPRIVALNDLFKWLGPTSVTNHDGLQDRFKTNATVLGIDQTAPIWYADDPSANPVSGLPETGPDPFFPTALRITLEVYDPANRFERPVRHVMVLPVGQG